MTALLGSAAPPAPAGASAFWLGRTATLGFGLRSHTLANLLRTRECVLNLPSVDGATAVDRLALTTGASPVAQRKQDNGYRHVKDKFGAAGLTPAASQDVAPPRVAECPVALEGTLTSAQLTDAATVSIAVSAVHVHPDIRMDGHANRIDPDRWRPLIMSFQRFYGLGAEVRPSRLATIDEESYR